MSPRAKTIKRILLGILIAPFALLLLLSILLYIPPVQRFVVAQVTRILSERTGMTVHVGRLHLGFPLDLQVGDVEVIKAPGDTLLTLGSLSLSPSLRPLFDKHLEVPRIHLQDATISYTDSTGLSRLRARLPEAAVEQLFVDLDREHVELRRLMARGGYVHYYSADTTKKEKDSDTIRWLIRAGEIDLAQTRVEVEMPLDSLFVTAQVTSLKATRGEADLERMHFRLAHARLEGRELSYAVDQGISVEPVFDYQHILASDIRLEAEDIDSEGMLLSLRLRQGQFREQSGLKLIHLSGLYRMDSTRIELEGLDLTTDASFIRGDMILPWSIMQGDSLAHFLLSAEASIGTKDILTFTGKELEELDQGGVFRGKLAHRQLIAPISLKVGCMGSLSELRLSEAKLRWPDVLSLSMQGKLYALTDARARAGKLYLDGKLGKKASLLLALVAPDLAKEYRLPADLTLRGNVDLRRGSYISDLSATEGTGSVSLKGRFHEATKSYEATLRVAGLDVRHFMPLDSIGVVSTDIVVRGQGFDPLSPRTHMSISGRLHEASWGSLQLHGLTLDGSLDKGYLGVSLNSENPGANLSLQLDGILSRKGITTAVGIDLIDLDLHRLGLSETPMAAKLRLEGELRSDLQDTHSFVASVDSMHFTLGEEVIAPPRADLEVTTTPQTILGTLSSGDMRSHLSISSGLSSLQRVLTKLSSEALSEWTLISSGKSPKGHLGNLLGQLPEAKLTLTMGKDNPLRYYLAEQSIAFGSLTADLNTSPSQGITGLVRVSDLRVDTLRVNSTELSLTTLHHPTARGDSMSLQLSAGIHKSRFRNQEGFDIKADLSTSLHEGALGLLWQDERGQAMHELHIQGSWEGEAYRLHFDRGHARIAYADFALNEENELRLRKRDNFLLGTLALTSKAHGDITLQAAEQESGVQAIDLNISNLHLEDYRSLGLPDVAGNIFAGVHYERRGGLSAQPTISGDLSLTGFRYEDKKLGHFSASLFYEPRDNSSHYITADIGYNGQSAMTIDGIYRPQQRVSPLSGTLSLNAFPLELANPFILASGASLEGTAGGTVSLSGQLTAPILSGRLALSQGVLNLNTYGTHLRLDSIPLRMEQSNLFFDHYAIRPSADPTKAIYIDGSITRSTTPQARAELRVTSDELTLLNEPRPTREDQLLYGRIIASTNMRVSGLMTSLRVRGSLNILSGTNCTYVLREDPLQSSERMGELVEFKDFSDTLFINRSEVAPPSLGGLDVGLTINVDPSVRIGADLTTDGQDYVHAQGGGRLNFTYPPYGEMSLVGRYEMSGGGELSYTLPVVGNKQFAIDPTSTLAWNGSVTNPYLNFTATQKVKASVPTSDGKSTQRVNFNVSIRIKDYVDKMNLSFAISSPDNLSMQNTISTMSAEEQSKQAIALMATGMYLSNTAGAGNLSLNSALSSLLQSQINQTAGKLLQGTDLSIGMDHYDGSSGEAAHTDYTYSFSRRFYNDRIRIVVGGKVQSGANRGNQGQNFLDNVSIQYQVDKSGEQYFSLYHKRVTDNILEGEYSETGVGYVLRCKMNSLLDVFNFLKKKPKLSPQKVIAQPWRLGGGTKSTAGSAPRGGATPLSPKK
jgi:conserved domain protein